VRNALAKVDSNIHDTVARANVLMPRVEAGDNEAKAELRQILDGDPDLWIGVGDLALQSELSVLRVITGNNDILKEGITRKLDQLRRDLKGPNPTPLETLLITRVVATWLALTSAETRYHNRIEAGISWDETEHWQRLIDRAHKRYLSAIRTLATVRRLVLPTVQVNLSNQAINVAK
jgi:hypothetical protein